MSFVIDKQPCVSIIMPIRNEELFIRGTIESLLQQDFEDFELLIIDDDSQDGTKNILEEFCHRDSRIKVIYNKPKVSFVVSLNQGIKIANNPY